MPPKTPSMIGSTGLRQYGGYIEEEYLRDLQGECWHRVVREMQTDAVIGGVLFAIEMLMRQVTVTVVAASDEKGDKEVAAFVDTCLHDMREPWPLTLAEILSFIPWGWATLNKVYKLRQGEITGDNGERDDLKSSAYDDGKIGWATWSIRAQETTNRWVFDDAGGVVGFIQVAPPAYVEVPIPLSACLHFRTTSRKGNPEGLSTLRTAYDAWYYRKHIRRIEGIGVERDLAGIPVAEVPAAILSPERTAEEAAVYNAIYQIVTNLRRDEQEGVVWPGDRDERGNKLYDLRLLSTGGTRQFDTGKIIERNSTEMAMSLLADFIFLGHQGVGSWALASSKTSLFATALGAWLDTICAVINTQAIPQLLRLNGYKVKAPPKLTHGDIETMDLGALGTYLEALSHSAALFSGESGQLLYRHLLEQAGLPAPAAQAMTDQSDQGGVPPSPAQTTEKRFAMRRKVPTTFNPQWTERARRLVQGMR